MLNVVILGLCCLLSLAHPAGGILLLLVLESSIFYLGSLATVPLPVGYAGPSDVMILCILAGALLRANNYDILPREWHRGQVDCQGVLQQGPSRQFDLRIKRVLILTIVPYLVWFGFCAICSAAPGDETWTVNVRSVANYIIPWALVPAIWLCRDQVRLMRRGILAIASATAIIHLGIQLLDYRPLMTAAYWSYLGGATDYVESVIAREDFVRALPAGVMLMLLVGIYAFSSYLLEPSHRRRCMLLAVAILQFAGIGITFTRSLMLEIIAGCVLACMLAIRSTADRQRLKESILASGLVFALMAAVIILERPDVAGFWQQRMERLDEDSLIFSTDTLRGQDNLAACSAIEDRPLLGWGTPRSPSRYALRDEQTRNQDIHPLLSVGLVGGLPCIALVLLMQGGLAGGLWMKARQSLPLRAAAMPALVIVLTAMLVINTIGAGGTFSGRGLLAFALMLGLGASELSRAASMQHAEQDEASVINGLSPAREAQA